MSKILTVIIPSYNVEEYLDEILPTYIANQILDDIEVLIINDGSRDETVHVAQKFETQYPTVFRVVDKPNGGHGSTINRGIKEAIGKYIKVIDGDDYVDTDAFINYVNALKKIDVDAVYTPFTRVNITTKTNQVVTIGDQVSYNKVYSINDIDPKLFEKNYALHSWTFNQNVLRKIPKISEKLFYVDQEYIMYALAFIKNVYFLNDNIYQYRVGNSSQSMAIENQKKNVWMLEKVTFNILDFYQKNNLLPVNTNEIYKCRIAEMFQRLIHIYISIGNPESKKSLIKIINIIKNKESLNSRVTGVEYRLLSSSILFYPILVISEKIYHQLKWRK